MMPTVQRQYCPVSDNTILNFLNICSSKRLKVASRHSPPVSLEPKRWEHVQEALVKETGWNDGVAGPEQRGVLSVGRDVCYTTVKRTLLELISSHHQGKKGSCSQA